MLIERSSDLVAIADEITREPNNTEGWYGEGKINTIKMPAVGPEADFDLRKDDPLMVRAPEAQNAGYISSLTDLRRLLGSSRLVWLLPWSELILRHAMCT